MSFATGQPIGKTTKRRASTDDEAIGRAEMEEQSVGGAPAEGSGSPGGEQQQQQLGSKGNKRPRSRNSHFPSKKTFASQFTLNRMLQCPVDKCEGQFRFLPNMRYHLSERHGIDINGVEMHSFISEEVFLKWKANEERLTRTEFLRSDSTRSRHDGARVDRYLCNRGGGVEEGKLLPKGSCKTGAACPASITANRRPDGGVDVKYISTHVGHPTVVEELHLTDDERRAVIGMVAERVPFNTLLDRVRDLQRREVSGLEKVIEKDLKIIDKTFELWQHGPMTKPSNLVVINLVAELTKLGGDNPVALSILPWRSVDSTVDTQDAVVVVMNTVQCEMLRRFGNDGLVCVDVTATNEGCEKVDFDLVTVMTVDSFGQAYPCAICLTNSLDQKVFATFFETIRSKVGKIRPEYFMSGEDPVHYECWSGVMGEPEKRLLSSWKIDQAWRKNLSKIVSHPYQKAAAYKALRVLIHEPDARKFELLMIAFKFHALQRKPTEQFGKYLESEWEGRADQWAFCHRGEECARCDLELEAMHLTLAHIHRNGSQARMHMDTTLQAIFRFVHHKSLGRLAQCCADMCPVWAADIASRHADTLALDLDSVFAFPDNRKWIVRSQERGEFLVERTAEECAAAADCVLRCHACALCVHEIMCSCTDSIIRGTLCKHIHLVGRYASEGIVKVEVMEEELEEELEEGLREEGIMGKGLEKEEVLPQIASVRSYAEVSVKVEDLVTESSEGLTDEPGEELREGLKEDLKEGLREKMEELNDVSPPQMSLVRSHAEVGVKVEDLVADIDAITRRIVTDAGNINDREVLQHLREGLRRLEDVSRAASSSSIVCIPMQDLQSVLCAGSMLEARIQSE